MNKHNLSAEDLAYIAGFFDGEGSVTIHENGRPSPRGISPNHTLQASIGNTDPIVLRWIHENFGGSLTYRKTKRENSRNIAQWAIRARSALPFLEAIRPYIRMKGQQIDVAIEYQKTKTMRGPKKVTAQDIVWREEQRQKIRGLNAIHHLAVLPL